MSVDAEGTRDPIDPDKVFTPRAGPPRDDMFAERSGSFQETFQNSLRSPDDQIFLYGATGIGKTSLVHHVCNRLDMPFVWVSTPHTRKPDAFELLLSEALSQLKPNVTVERVRREGR